MKKEIQPMDLPKSQKKLNKGNEEEDDMNILTQIEELYGSEKEDDFNPNEF